MQPYADLCQVSETLRRTYSIASVQNICTILSILLLTIAATVSHGGTNERVCVALCQLIGWLFMSEQLEMILNVRSCLFLLFYVIHNVSISCMECSVGWSVKAIIILHL